MPRKRQEIFYRKDRQAWYLRIHTENSLLFRKLADDDDIQFKSTRSGRRRRSQLEIDCLLEEIANKIKASLNNTTAVANLRMSEWVEIWINQLTVRTEKARKEYRSAVLKFIEIVGDLKLASLSANSSSEFIKRCDADGLSRNSTRSYLRMVGIYLNFLHSQGFIPKITLKNVAEEDRVRGVYNLTDLEHIQAAMSERNRNGLRMVMMLRYLGLRASEVRTLPLRHIFLSQSEILIRHVPELNWYPKKGKAAILPVPIPLQEFLVQDLAARDAQETYYLDTGSGHPAFCDVSAMTKLVRPVVKELGLKGKVKPLHGFRASLVTTLMKAKVPLPVIAEICRHSKTSTTERYAYLDQSDMRAALAHVQ